MMWLISLMPLLMMVGLNRCQPFWLVVEPYTFLRTRGEGQVVGGRSRALEGGEDFEYAGWELQEMQEFEEVHECWEEEDCEEFDDCCEYEYYDDEYDDECLDEEGEFLPEYYEEYEFWEEEEICVVVRSDEFENHESLLLGHASLEA